MGRLLEAPLCGILNYNSIRGWDCQLFFENYSQRRYYSAAAVMSPRFRDSPHGEQAVPAGKLLREEARSYFPRWQFHPYIPCQPSRWRAPNRIFHSLPYKTGQIYGGAAYWQCRAHRPLPISPPIFPVLYPLCQPPDCFQDNRAPGIPQLFPEMLHQQQDILLIIRQINQFCHVSCLPKNAAVYPLSELLQKNHTFYSEKCKWLPQFCHNLPPFFARCFRCIL